ncbi:MAG TPA: acyl-CoA dehydrogenase family protein [Stellaceae bacterium]|nr:acyl-CoA dehydrogenase family protein [Stellaceae bacterium]
MSDGTKGAMNLLRRERAALEELLPGLDAELAGLPLLDMEQRGNPAIPVFRRLGGPGLLVPSEFGGCGASALQAVRAQRAIGSRAPSLAVATTMHHFTIASLLEIDPADPGLERELLESVAREHLYVGSGFAEGKTGMSIQTSALRMERGAGGWILNGSKKPCSLSVSMDFFALSTPAPEGMNAGLAAAIIPADTPGLERRPFWQSPILAGAESDEVVLRDVLVPEDALFPLGGSGRSNAVQDRGFLWFELLIAASYLGIASALVERVLRSGRGSAVDRVRLASETEGAMAALEGIARAMLAGERGNEDLARMVLVRYAVQGAIERATSLALELMGGMAFIESAEVSYLLAASRGLSLHPPSRPTTVERLDAHLAGRTFVID